MTDPLPLRVLVVEDDADASANLHDILELDRHTVQAVGTAAAALACPQLPSADVILLDRKLPDSSAEQLLPRLKARARGCDVIIITGHADLDSAITAIRLGATDYLLKPINPDVLRICLNRIAENRRLLRAKQQSESAFRQLVEAAPSMIVILRPDGSIAYFSPFAEKAFGWRPNDVMGQDFARLFLPETEQNSFMALLSRTMSGSPTRGRELLVRAPDGTELWTVWNSQRIDDFEGGPAVLMAGLDVTEQKRALDRLIQSERLAALGEAMASLAHESRNALQRSQANLEMLARRIQGRPEEASLLERIQRAQDDLHQLYEEVRSYAAPMNIAPEPCDVRDILTEAWDQLAIARHSRAATLTINPPEFDTCCTVDRSAIRRVFRNIIDNSLDACPDPVEIRVEFLRTLLGAQRALCV
jgi:PAS domain S-box-containing protein